MSIYLPIIAMCARKVQPEACNCACQDTNYDKCEDLLYLLPEASFGSPNLTSLRASTFFTFEWLGFVLEY